MRPKRAPHMPTQAEVAAHEITHEPYRDWCRACVAGRGLADKHVQADHSEVALPTVAFDYGYLGDREEECSPILCGKDRDSRWYYGILMPCKGTQDAYCAKQTTTELSLAGHRRFVLRSDGEPAILALRTLVCAKLAGEHGQETVVETSPVGDSQGNGLAEQAVREVKAKTRTLKFHTEELVGVRIGNDSTVLPWLVKHAVAMINRGRKGPDGRTAWELRHGRPYRRELAMFGEKILYQPVGKRPSRLDPRFIPGIFFGVVQWRAARKSWLERTRVL